MYGYLSVIMGINDYWEQISRYLFVKLWLLVGLIDLYINNLFFAEKLFIKNNHTIGNQCS